MHKLIFLLPFFVLIGCGSEPTDPIAEILSKPMTESDSLMYMDLLFKDMEEERMEFVNRVQMGCKYRQDGLIFCGIRCQFSIRSNSQDQIMVRNEVNGDITERLFEYYAFNMKRNDVTSNFPLYNRINRATILEQQSAVQDELNIVLTEKDSDDKEDALKFIRGIVDMWEKKLKCMKTIDSPYLSEPSSSCLVKVDCRNGPKLRKLILNKAIAGFYLLRDFRANQYFNESYLELFRRYKLTNKQVDLDKIEALQVLHPIRMITSEEDCSFREILPPPVSE